MNEENEMTADLVEWKTALCECLPCIVEGKHNMMMMMMTNVCKLITYTQAFFQLGQAETKSLIFL